MPGMRWLPKLTTESAPKPEPDKPKPVNVTLPEKPLPEVQDWLKTVDRARLETLALRVYAAATGRPEPGATQLEHTSKVYADIQDAWCDLEIPF